MTKVLQILRLMIGTLANMKYMGMRLKSAEIFVLDVSEGILVGGIAGFILGILLGTLLWAFVWQMLPTVYALPDILFAGQWGILDGMLLGGFGAFYWRLKMVLEHS